MISIVICSIDPRRFEAVSKQYAHAMAGQEFEIVGIHDAKSMCEGYNRGFAKSRGDLIIFSHDDIEFWVENVGGRLKGLLKQGNLDVVGVAGATHMAGPQWVSAGPGYSAGLVPHVLPDGRILLLMFGVQRRLVRNIQVLDGLFIACRRDVAEKVAWDEATFPGFHHYDLDWSYRAFRAGFKLGVAVDLTVLHQSEGNFDQQWQQSAQRFLAKHSGMAKRPLYLEFEMARTIYARREDAMAVIADICNDLC